MEPLRSTFVPIERDPMLQAAQAIVTFFRERGPGIARSHGLDYPTDLDRVMGARFERLAETSA
jgi:hypothetical protein